MNHPIWTPNQQRIDQANLTKLIKQLNQQYKINIEHYQELHQWSVDNKEAFWSFLWNYFHIVGHRGDSVLLDGDKMPGAQWFSDAKLNFAENLLRSRDHKTALVFRGENGHRESISYHTLYTRVAKLSSALKKSGIKSGDRIAGFMPNCIDTVVAMLATTSLGAIWSSCSPDFGFQGLHDRFGQIEPTVIFTVDGYYYNGKSFDALAKIAQLQQKLETLNQIIVVPFLNTAPDLSLLSNATLLNNFIDPKATNILFEQTPFNHPLYIMFSSGTTGKPKCIVHGVGGTLLQHLKELILHTDLTSGDSIFYYSTCGWMMWNWLVSSLAVSATIVLYDGSPFYPNPSILWDIAEQESISIFGSSAKYYSALEKEQVKPNKSHQLDKLKSVLSTGSPLAPESYDYIYRDIKQDICLSSISGGTDIISCFALGNPILPVYPGELQCLGLAMDVNIVNETGQPVFGSKGELVCSSPFPSMPVGFWADNNDEKYRDAYFNRFPNIWTHGDYGEITEHNGLIIHGRSDAVLNPGGVRIGTAEIYRQVEKIEDVLESLAIGQEWQDDVRVILFVKLKSSIKLTEELTSHIKKTIRQNATPRHVPAKIIQIPDIPRTISGKIVELAVKNIIHNRPVTNTDALANPEALTFYKDIPELQT